MKIVVISGVPGTGKTTLANLLSSKLDGMVISLGEFVRERDLGEEWDADRQTLIVDEGRARNALMKEIERLASDITGWLIIEGLFCDVVADAADFAIVLRLHPRELRRRLRERGYGTAKVQENVQAEILGTCTFHMREAIGTGFMDIDTTNLDPSEIVEIILAVLEGRTSSGRHAPGKVNWLQDPGIDPLAHFGTGGSGA
ncbi:AAA family ATPase [Candidatus Bathyarchaeota archaeon]|nr:AAA family ATPase [Candidatus Bathyarchaeota archaeon]